ncbi:DUF2911 domain-containing protein [Acidobacteria bacterium AH-259-A15]|nr:DUF2911 domain-containing protein [Acidobacteria bacterium AH-259-A15]
MKGIWTVLMVTAFTLTLPAHEQERGMAQVAFDGKNISIDYGRPLLRGRNMLGRADSGIVWRMGTDQATSLVTEADLVFGDIRVAKGRYSLFAKKLGPDKWEVLVNSETDIWGTNHNPEKDVAAIPLQAHDLENSVEMFTITLESKGPDSGEFHMVWGTKELRADFQVK